MTETVFTYAAPALKFGRGAAAEIGYDVRAWGARRVLLVTDPGVAATGHPERVAEGLRARDLEVVVFDRSRVEPTDVSLEEAVAFARPRVRSTRSSRSGAAPRSTPPRRSRCW
ncbi:iron-containing alcohol dehydrogenase [Pimelobacter simplex]|uniref:iron-containing alcohol dehydrogenase n=1 Tax=Nocardioides simplex TaxID=2045 RepID=UPI0020B171A8|nr:iron-containing alcohol dehydrogenase [Pimelobacter simplex]